MGRLSDEMFKVYQSDMVSGGEFRLAFDKEMELHSTGIPLALR